MDRFIETVKSFPCLWDVGDPAYKDNDVTEKVWEQVAVTTKYPNAKSAKVQWKKLRDNFREALKRQKDKINGRTWRYTEHMQFLVPFMQSKWQINGTILDSDKSPAIEISDCTSLHTTEDKPSFLECSLGEDGNDSSSSFQPKRRKTSSIYDGDKDDREFTRNCVKPGNALLNFFTSMYNSTEELPPQMQLQVKRKIFEVVAEAEETAFILKQQEVYDETPYIK